MKNARRLGEEPVMDTLVSSCSKRLLNQPPSSSVNRVNLAGLDIPDVPIPANRQMFQASALAKHNLTSVNRFYSDRNLAMLAALRKGIEAEENPAMREKLMFGFTAILTRASKRYQWSHRRPLNAANQTYYIAPVFYEWNVLDLFQRKLKAIARSDAHIQASLNGAWPGEIDARYEIASADLLPLCDESIDYVFTDPPFGSNIFYSDMNLFQEAWLRAFTDESKEAVVDRSHNVGAVRTPERYERILTDALIEAHRVLKPHGWLSLVFGNSSGAVWSMVQRAINKAGFVIDPEGLTLLDKGQRSVKGLNSGFERVVTIDLVMSMRKRLATDADIEFRPSEVAEAVDLILAGQTPLSPSEAYISVVRECLRRHWDLEPVSYAAVVRELERRKLKVDLTTGMFRSSD
ncbi:MAG TPA: hypothetical protein VGZ22_12605 [Isosphaeraceae bacterium]|nr:hypothetical protein [Isosphaeraceae bacterium]